VSIIDCVLLSLIPTSVLTTCLDSAQYVVRVISAKALSNKLAGFLVLTAASMKMVVFWVLAPCSLVDAYQNFRGTCYLQHQDEDSAATQETAIFIPGFYTQITLTFSNSLHTSFLLVYHNLILVTSKLLTLVKHHKFSTLLTPILEHFYTSSVRTTRFLISYPLFSLMKDFPTKILHTFLSHNHEDDECGM
jgi:hypothetical protein